MVPYFVGQTIDSLVMETGGNTLDLGAAPGLYRSIERIDLADLARDLGVRASVRVGMLLLYVVAVMGQERLPHTGGHTDRAMRTCP